jgi:hypothetical protein
LLRRWKHIALIAALAICARAERGAFADPPEIASETEGSEDAPSAGIEDSPPAELELPPEVSFGGPRELPEPLLPPDHVIPGPPPEHRLETVPEGEEEPGPPVGPPETDDSFSSVLKHLGLRHSSTCGRNAGLGIPLVGTSWLNRPYYIGADIGTVWLTRPVNDRMTEDVDMFGDVFGGCDWDYYWGTELAVHRATPELINEHARHADRGDRLMEWTACLMYYPWGDAMFRPYWRLGLGATDIDYPTDGGRRRDEELWTIPIGVGLKYPIRHWLAARAEFADQLALGNNGVATQHDLTLTFGLEWRFGARPRSYWPWNPSRHIW